MAPSLPLCGPLAGPCHVMNGRRHGVGLGLSRQGLLPCRAPLARSWTLSVAVRASKDGASGGQAPPPYTDMLLQREYELWQRQSRMYDALLEQHEREQQRWAAERERWVQQEDLLKQEVAELRAQLLYVLSRGPASGVGGGSSAAPASAAFVPQQQRQVAGREPAALPLGLTGLSPAEQVQAVVEAVKAGSGVVGPQEAAARQQGTAAPNSSSAAAQAAEGAGLPRYAAELAAAVAAVDELDVLSDDLDFSALADRLAARAPPAAPVAAPVATPTAVPAAPPPPPASAAATATATPQQQPQQQQQQQQEQPVAPAPAPAGPRPTLVTGSDDIYWMHQLHSALVEAGYYPGEDDCEEFFFGESTLSAVLTLQACEGLPETGVVDEATWQVLAALAPGLANAAGPQPESGAPGAAAEGAAPASPPAAEPSPSSSSSSSKPYQELFSLAVTEVVAAEEGGVRAVHEVTVTDSVQSVGGAGGALVERVTIHEESRVEAAGSAARTAWPVLMEGDGGRDVHAMHVALQQNGYYASDDDIRWWQFGDTTLAALKTFQACSGLPESGVCDPLTWRALLGSDASPSDLVNLRSDDSADEEDLARTDRVWLMGEQRWEDRSRMKKK